MRRFCVELVVGILALLLIGPSLFVIPGRAAEVQNSPVLRATTHLVVVNVVVHDKKGVPVTGLTRSDFTVLDNGKEEKIAEFSIKSRGNALTREPLPPDTFSNRVARLGNVPANVAVVLFDRTRGFTDGPYARQHIIKFLSQLHPQDQVAMYVHGRGLWVVQDFTNDSALLLAAIRREQRLPFGVSQANESSGEPLVSSPLTSLGGREATDRLGAGIELLTKRLEMTGEHLDQIAALEEIANHLSGMPGRKSIIWVTGDVPNVTPSARAVAKQKFRRMIQMLNQADVAVYPVDAHGLAVDPSFEAEQAEPGPGISSLDGIADRILAMDFLAHETGGLAFFNTNDLKAAMRTALDESEISYTLSYYPTHGCWNGEFRSLKILVDRKDVEVLHRRGYLANSDVPGEPSNDAVALMKTEAHNPLGATGLGVTVRLRRQEGSSSEGRKIVVYVDTSGLTFQPAKASWSVALDIWAGVYSKGGDCLGGTVKSVSGTLHESNYQKIQLAGRLAVELQSKAHPKSQELRVVVRDAASGLMGSVRIPLPTSPRSP